MIHSAPMPGIRSGPMPGALPSLHTFSGGGVPPHGFSPPHTFNGGPAGASITRAPHGLSQPHADTVGGSHAGVATGGQRAGRQIGLTAQNAKGLLSQHDGAAHSSVSSQPPASQAPAGQHFVTRSLQGVGQASVLRNGTFASHFSNAATRALASATFHGRFANEGWKFSHNGWFWRHRHPIIVIGWVGPIFWPYAYWDFVDYTFWPYAYDVFWPYAYDDLYVGVFGPYSYEGPAPAAGRRVKTARTSAPTAAEVCREQVPMLTGWPIQEIARTVQPDPTQQAALDELKDAAGKAIDALQSACPDDLPSTPTGRLAAMRKRIGVMLQAVGLVKPALDHFYELLSDEQKARFNPIVPAARPATPTRAGNRPPDLSQVCSGQAANPTAPTERIAQAVHPSETQRAALEELGAATARAADDLKANCAVDEALTPPGRLAAMEQRLNAMLEAIKIVQPALESFYGSLSDEQKARFNQLGVPQS
jgi:hypothetical protein